MMLNKKVFALEIFLVKGVFSGVLEIKIIFIT